MAIQGLFRRKQDEEEKEPEDLGTININIGSGGLLDVETVDKTIKYQRLLTEITSDTIKDIATIFEKAHEQSGTKSQAYQMMTDAGIPLEYLIALGITNEESIYGFQVLSQRGILEGGVAKQPSQNGVDEDYVYEVQELERQVPALVTLTGESVPERPTLTSLNDRQLQKIIEQETQYRQLELQYRQLEAQLEQVQQTSYGVDEDEDFVTGVMGAMQVTTELDLAELVPDITTDAEELEKPVPNPQENELHKYLDKLRQKAGDYDAGSEPEDELYDYTEDENKTVYILAQEFHIEPIDGYTVKFIEASVDLNLYTNSKNNLLVITNNVPRYILNVFVDWIKGISDSNKKYRIVTLEGAEMSHPLIEAVIELTKESLDNYYETNELAKYTGKGVGSFLDISDFFND